MSFYAVKNHLFCTFTCGLHLLNRPKFNGSLEGCPWYGNEGGMGRLLEWVIFPVLRCLLISLSTFCSLLPGGSGRAILVISSGPEAVLFLTCMKTNVSSCISKRESMPVLSLPSVPNRVYFCLLCGSGVVDANRKRASFMESCGLSVSALSCI